MRNRRPDRLAGFTIVELLVVVAIVLIVLAMLAPAVQQSRQEAQQAQCRNNLKQLGLAIHNYHDVSRTFPPGWIALHPHPQSEPRFGWTASLLPYFEQQPLFERLDFNKPIPLDDPIIQTAIRELRCPSDPAPAVNPLRSNMGTSNYSGNAGDRPFPRWTAGRLSAYWPGHGETEYFGRPVPGNAVGVTGQPPFARGLFWFNSACRMADVVDGTSNTLLIGERSYASGAGVWPGVGSNEFEDDVLTECSYASPLNRSITSYSSRHPGGVNFVLADGQVRFLSDTIDSARSPADQPGIYQRLANRSEGLPIDGP